MKNLIPATDKTGKQVYVDIRYTEDDEITCLVHLTPVINNEPVAWFHLRDYGEETNKINIRKHVSMHQYIE